MDRVVRRMSDMAFGLTKRAQAPAQAGIFSGDKPSQYNLNDPIRLWIIQVIIIVIFTQLLSLLLSRIRQPRVISEVIGGIILGPSIMGRIPGFSNAIFPTAGMPMLNLTSNIGLVLFLFLVGLEIDVRVVKRNLKSSSLISVAGLVLPLGLGAALGVPIYHQFIDPSINFGYFLLFVAVSIGITAFPVLCRILTELKLLDTTVGVVTLSAGVGNDVVGWILLALTVALVNAGNGLTALWVLLTGVGYVIFMLFAVKPAFKWLAQRTGSLESGQPTALVMTVTLMVVFISAFFTDVIGIHAIFGGFLAGLVIPHENGFAIAIVEKLEDVVSLLLLPLYFTFSGLKTNLGLLNNGITWGYTILICVVAFFSKFLACSITAKLTGFNIRESGAIGALMSCKGLVELIVLNVGLSAGILDTRTFSMFVVHALILTFMTTPITLLFYPPQHRTHYGVVVEKTSAQLDSEGGAGGSKNIDGQAKTRFSMVFDTIQQIPAAMTLMNLLKSAPGSSDTASIASIVSDEKDVQALPELPAQPPSRPISVDALRLIELTERTSAVLKSQEADSLIHSDPIVSILRTYGHLNRIAVSAALSVVTYDEFPASVAKHAQESGSHMVIIPWARGTSAAAQAPEGEHSASGSTYNPFDGIFSKSTPVSVPDQTSSTVYTQYIRRVFAESPSDVALFVDRGVSSSGLLNGKQHLFLPFFGGPDDRLALSFVVQLCGNANVSAHVVRITKTEEVISPVSTIEEAKTSAAIHTTGAFADTVYGQRDTQTYLASETADNVLWERFTSSSATHAPTVADALTRITFAFNASPRPLAEVVETAATQQTHSGCTLVVLGRSRRLAVESHQAELRDLIAAKGGSVSSELPKTLGDVGAAFVASGSTASLLILQATA
ncbi:hypothetical protein PLICRDRAFT_33408 [Plicaturopsis crispa FD-325 SS-3]|nr:hypothetical protein PLICRDRAFT_33408 [Plicaturopsis crispa FD-325 SS-3]